MAQSPRTANICTWPWLQPLDGLFDVCIEDRLAATHASVVTFRQTQEHCLQLVLDTLRQIVFCFFGPFQPYSSRGSISNFTDPRIGNLRPSRSISIWNVFPVELVVVPNPMSNTTRCVTRKLLADSTVNTPLDLVFVCQIPSYLQYSDWRMIDKMIATKKQTNVKWMNRWHKTSKKRYIDTKHD